MALEVYEFAGLITIKSQVAQVAFGSPLVAHTTTGAKTLNAKTVLLRITGDGSITWPGGVEENFDGVEFRGVQGGTEITIG